MKPLTRNIVLLGLMLFAAGLSSAMRPTIVIADELPPIDLKQMIPAEFGEWKELKNQASQILDPQRQQVIDQLYSQTLARTYVNPQGYIIMLSVAYGKNQSNTLQIHKPDLCYPAQGFTVISGRPASLGLAATSIPVFQLETNLGLRFEPLTYWTVVGDRVTKDGVDKKVAEIRYAMKNRIPDGMLVRVSSIDRDTKRAYDIQMQFSSAMVQAIAPQNRSRFAGALTN